MPITQTSVLPTVKTCSRCRTVKALDEFAQRNDRVSGRHSQCKVCVAEAKRSEYAKNSTRYRDALRKAKFGITPEEYWGRVAEQDGKCAICAKPETVVIGGKVADLAVDHDHDTGKVRQLLCLQCNRGLSAFLDTPELVDKAAAYLRKHGR